MKRRHLIILTAVVLVLILAGPVSAYSISVSGNSGSNYKSTKFESYVNSFQITKPRPTSTIDTSITSTTGSQGSVSAFTSGSYSSPSSFLEFKQVVSVNGVINGFSFSANYDSGMFG